MKTNEMPIEERRAFMLALLHGKSCKVSTPDHSVRIVRLDDTLLNIEEKVGKEWRTANFFTEDCLTWEESIEPRVWEGWAVVVPTKGLSHDGDEPRHINIATDIPIGTKVRYRIEEVIKGTP